MPTRSKLKPWCSQVNNTDPTNFMAVSRLALPEFRIPRDLYDVLKMHVQEYPQISTKSRNYLKCLQSLPNVGNIPCENYTILFKILLYIESFHKQMEKKKSNLRDWPIKFETMTRCRIDLPYLNEDDPIVKEDELVQLKFKKKSLFCKVIGVGLKYIIVEVDPSAMKLSETTCEVKFIYSNWNERCAHYALHLVHKYQFSKTFFPEVRPGYVHPDHEMYWINNKVGTNIEQQKAILNILDKTALPSPYIIFGPPGTGKTATLVETICQIWQKDPSTRVLICTPSNAGADEITRRVLKFIPARSVYRMYAPSVKGKEVDNIIKPCANLVDGQTVFLPKEVLLFKKIVVSTLVSSARLWTLNLPPDHFSYVFIDEASQAIEPESLIPLSLIVGKQGPKLNGTLYGQIVLAGDPWQLGPVVQSKIVEHILGVSMLERMMKLEPYKKNEKGKYNEMYITKLVNNYRNHEAILHTSNKLFYDNELQVFGNEDTKKVLGWKCLPNPKCPIIFHHVHGKEEKVNNSKSSFNTKEINVVVGYIKLLMEESFGSKKVKLKQAQIGIVTPFKLQQYHIKKQLEKMKYSNIAVGTVEIFQGQERDVIIVSTVRSQIFKNQDSYHIGFLSNPKRLNVALTRAKSLLIVVGNEEVLKTDEYWKEFIKYCASNNAIIH